MPLWVSVEEGKGKDGVALKNAGRVAVRRGGGRRSSDDEAEEVGVLVRTEDSVVPLVPLAGATTAHSMPRASSLPPSPGAALKDSQPRKNAGLRVAELRVAAGGSSEEQRVEELGALEEERRGDDKTTTRANPPASWSPRASVDRLTSAQDLLDLGLRCGMSCWSVIGMLVVLVVVSNAAAAVPVIPYADACNVFGVSGLSVSKSLTKRASERAALASLSDVCWLISNVCGEGDVTEADSHCPLRFETQTLKDGQTKKRRTI